MNVVMYFFFVPPIMSLIFSTISSHFFLVTTANSDGFAKGGLGKAQPKTRQRGYDEVLDILP